MTEQELIMLLRQQPARGLSLLIDRYTGLVLAVLRAKGGNLLRREDLEELASDCFLAVYDMRNRLDPAKGSVAALVASVAQKKAVDRLRQLSRRPKGEPLENNETLLALAQPDPTEALCERTALLTAVRGLGEPDATILFRTYYLGQTRREVGDALGLSENAVTKRLRRSLQKLRDTMKGETAHGLCIEKSV